MATPQVPPQLAHVPGVAVDSHPELGSRVLPRFCSSCYLPGSQDDLAGHPPFLRGLGEFLRGPSEGTEVCLTSLPGPRLVLSRGTDKWWTKQTAVLPPFQPPQGGGALLQDNLRNFGPHTESVQGHPAQGPGHPTGPSLCCLSAKGPTPPRLGGIGGITAIGNLEGGRRERTKGEEEEEEGEEGITPAHGCCLEVGH